jgi:alpha-tubulin suppressor-like RCC1 family protein
MKNLTLLSLILFTSCFAGLYGQSIDGGGSHSILLCSDGHVWTCGNNSRGQLGDSLSNGKIVLEEVVGLNNIKSISAGAESSYALTNEGEVWSWGSNEFGQLGFNSLSGIVKTPVKITGLTNVKSIHAGWFNAFFILNDGTVWACGRNDAGQLGIDTIGVINVPILISSLQDIEDISAGYYHTLALKADGTVWAWGYNLWGQLGDGTTTSTKHPIKVINLDSISSIAAGWDHSLALSQSGEIFAWGQNLFGQLGIGAPMINATHPIPAKIQAVTNGISINAEQNFSQILDGNGHLWLMGRNDAGQLGNNSTLNSNVPLQVETLNDIVQIGCGMYFSFGIDRNGSVWSWGGNGSGQIGDSTTVSRSMPGPMILNCSPMLGTYYHENHSSQTITVSPNPFTLSTNIRFPNAEGESYSISVYNSVGQLILNQSAIHEGDISFMRNDLKSGVYIFKIHSLKSYIGSGVMIIN